MKRRDFIAALDGTAARDAGGIDCGRDGYVLYRPSRNAAAGRSHDMARIQSSDPAAGRVALARYHRPRHRTAETRDELAPSHPSLPRTR
jgi:hypothetical protein